MYEQQQFDVSDTGHNPARELSASLFSEQIHNYQSRDGQGGGCHKQSEQTESESINEQLGDNIYSKKSEESTSSDAGSTSISQPSETTNTGVSETFQPAVFNRFGALKLRSNIINGGREETAREGNHPRRVYTIDNSPPTETTEEVDDKPKTKEEQIEEAVDWAKDNFDRIDLTKDGLLSKWELDLPQLTGQASEHDLEMLKILSDNKDEIKFAHIDKFGKGLEKKDGITMKDLNVIEKHFDKQDVFENAEAESREIAENLLQGDKPLFDFLDRASNGKLDGKIGKRDLERYMNDYNYLKQYGVDSGPYSQENVDTVKRLLDTWDVDKFPGPGTRMRGIVDSKDILEQFIKSKDYKYITRDKVVRAAGLG